jgi:hypothetical protein
MRLNAAQKLIQSFYTVDATPGARRFAASDYPPHRPIGTPPKLRRNKNRGEKKRAARAAANEKERQRQEDYAERYPHLAFSLGSLKEISND